MADSVAADHNTTTTSTMIANFVVSSLSSLLPIFLSYAIEFVKLIPSLTIHLSKFLFALLMSTFDEILPPGRRILTLHHYLITARDESLLLVKYCFECSVAKFDEFYPPVKHYLLVKSEDAIRFLQGCCVHLLTRFDDAFPPGERAEALWNYTEAGKQYLAIKFAEIYPPVKRFILIKSEVSIQLLQRCCAHLLNKFDYSFPPVERSEAGRSFWMVRFKELLGSTVHKLSELFDAEEETVKLIGAACIGALIGMFCLRLCCSGRKRTTMVAPGRGGGVRIRRNDFEGNPRDYFRNLRSQTSHRYTKLTLRLVLDLKSLTPLRSFLTFIIGDFCPRSKQSWVVRGVIPTSSLALIHPLAWSAPLRSCSSSVRLGASAYGGVKTTPLVKFGWGFCRSLDSSPFLLARFPRLSCCRSVPCVVGAWFFHLAMLLDW